LIITLISDKNVPNSLIVYICMKLEIDLKISTISQFLKLILEEGYLYLRSYNGLAERQTKNKYEKDPELCRAKEVREREASLLLLMNACAFGLHCDTDRSRHHVGR
jgi:hypothetical protein